MLGITNVKNILKAINSNLEKYPYQFRDDIICLFIVLNCKQIKPTNKIVI
ncbi:hypothetical protein CLJ_B2592 [Clostridium botulinum Ba4 str. 657]|uniref:Uncharacterized protein n=1 Tax=Clostridium botulinum (strain 657 / Type Ba4) TaxID=515621 RepID=A0A3F3A6C8_CLOB6|nr:hypothetical protein CLJ_B2592 [Clostridium botulinum Ba4 str. 657]